jgi:hypothetical protein
LISKNLRRALCVKYRNVLKKARSVAFCHPGEPRLFGCVSYSVGVAGPSGILTVSQVTADQQFKRPFPQFWYLIDMHQFKSVKIWVSALFLAGLATSTMLAAQQHSAIALVPAADWQQTGSQSFDVSAVSRWGGDPAVEREYGVKSVELRTYVLPVHGRNVQVVREITPDLSSAFGLLTYYRTPQMSPVPGEQLAVAGPAEVLAARGHAFLRMPTQGGSGGDHTSPVISTSELEALVRLAGGAPPSREAVATLPTYLPSNGLVPGSEKYLLGPEAAKAVLPELRSDLIGFEQGAELEVGTYNNNGRGSPSETAAKVAAISFPTPQIARERYARMEKDLALNQSQGSGSVYGKRAGSYVFLTWGASQAAAEQLLGSLRVTQQVTLNERYLGTKPVVLQMLELILANLLLVVTLVGLALLGGLLIALSKKAAHKWFPNSEWGDPDSHRLTTLNLR